MQTSLMSRPVAHGAIYGVSQPVFPLKVVDAQGTDRSMPRGLPSLVVARENMDELNNGDPPDLMLWGEE